MKFSLLTLGCKVNQSEINTIASSLTKAGHEIVSLSESPEICIINTCTVTSKSDYQSRQYLRRAVKSGAEVYATGCYAQLNGEEILSRISESIKIINNNNKSNIIKILNNYNESNTIDISHSRSRAFIKIQDGCNYSCSYCVIPLARGRSRSFESNLIIDEINSIQSSGINEIVLSGINIGLYGRDLTPQGNLKKLIRDILDKTVIPRIRLSSLEIVEIDDEMLEIMGNGRMCKHFHIPLQSGDDMILRNMKRAYTRDYFLNRLKDIINKYPYISIGSDVIVGFPGEGSAEFNNTLNFLKNSEISYFHVFPFSKRNNTVAASFANQIEKNIKEDRVRLLRSLSARKKLAYMKKFINLELDVIVEEKLNDNEYSSTSGNYIKVHLRSDNLKKKSLITARITGIQKDRLTGIPLNRA